MNSLNKEQKQAVFHDKGPLLIVAGAGTGKTTVLTKRIAHLMQKGVSANEILALTFTEKAAEEMQTRVESFLDFGYYDFWISTFHSFCDRILKIHGLEIGIPTNYKLLDETAAWILIKRNFNEFNFLKEYKPLGNPTKFIHALVRHFEDCKNEGIYPEDYLIYADSLKKDLVINDDLEYVQVNEVAEAYHTYQKLLLNNNSLDFGDLINYVLKLFKKHKKVLEKYQKQFQYVLIDEFQDTNFVQYELVKKIAEPKNNITVVGDDDQCLDENTLIEKIEGKTEIKNIKKGDKVLAGVGEGRIGVAKVLDVSFNKKEVDLLNIKTKKGKEILLTDNHKMFCLGENYEKTYITMFSKAENGLHTLSSDKDVSSSSLRELIKLSKEYTDEKVGVRFKAGLNDYAIMVPARELKVKDKIPIKWGNKIIYDQIIEIRKNKKVAKIYDLEIEKAHNFLANDILVHNSIFSFQGASFNNVLRFKSDYPKSKEIILTENYRSTQEILDLAYNFIQLNNPNRLEFQLKEDLEKIDKRLKSNSKEKGLLELLSFETADDEVMGVIDKIWELKEIDNSAKFSDFCVLVRTNETADQFVRGFERANMPCHFLASKGLYSHPIIIDIIAYFRVVLDFYDSPNLYRVLRSLPFDFSPEEVAKIGWFAQRKTIPLFEAIQKQELLNELSKETGERLKELIVILKNHFELSKEKNISEVFVRMINDLHYARCLKQATEENLRVWEIIYQFFQKTKNFENSNHDGKLIAFMDQIQMELDAGEEGSLDNQVGSESDSVKIMTIHSAKGLEFKYVFVVSLVHRRFPSDRKHSQIKIPEELVKEIIGKGDFHLEEERRLFYVALTRAKKGLFLTWASDYGGKQLKKPSRFLIEAGLIKEEDALKQKLKRERFSFQKNFNNFKKESNEILDISYGDFLPLHFSFSQLAAFEKCPLQYKFEYILKIPTKGKPNFSFGKTIHNTLYRFVNLNAQIFQKEQKNLFGKLDIEREKVNLGINDLLSIYNEEWIDAWFDNEEHKKEYKKKGKEILKSFYKDFLKKGFCVLYMENEPALEKDFSINLNGNKFVGSIDRIDKIKDEIEIIDYKTGNVKKSLSADDKFQLEIYNLVANKLFNITPSKLTFYYLEEGKHSSFEPKVKSLKKTEEKILNIIKRIKRSKFKPTAGWQCQFCDYKDICPHRKF